VLWSPDRHGCTKAGSRILADWKQAVAAFSAATDPQVGVDIYMAIHDLIVKDDVAIHRYRGTAVITSRGGGEPRRDSRKYVDVLRRGADGRWKTAIHIFNKNE